MAVTNTALGNLHFVIKGDYNAGASYIVDDVVTYRNSDYLCTADATPGTLPTDTNYFKPIRNSFKFRGMFDATPGVQYYKNDVVEVGVPLDTETGNANVTAITSRAFYICLADNTSTGAITDQPWHNNANWHKLSAMYDYDDTVINSSKAKQLELYTGDSTECVWLANWRDGMVGGDEGPYDTLGGNTNSRSTVDWECFIDGTGNIKSWGSNSNGQNGLNFSNMGTATGMVFPFLDWYRSTDNGGSGVHSTPDGEMPKVVQLVAGYQRAMALFNNGEVYSWGYGGHGQNGDRSSSTRTYPVRVGGTYQEIYLATNTSTHVWRDIRIKKIYTNNCNGYDNNTASSYALDENGDLWAWGYNGYGQLGQNNTTNLTVPTIIDRVTYFGGNSIVEFWCTGGQYGAAYAVDTAGNLYAWGYNGYGQLGLGDTTQRTVPTLVTNPVFDSANEGTILKLMCDHFGSYGRAAILTSKGRIFTTGYNGYGWAMAGNTNQQNIWTQCTLGPGSGVNATASNMWLVGNGQYGSFWVWDQTAEEMYTCGRNNYYQLSNGNASDISSPGIAQWDINGTISKIKDPNAVMSWSSTDVHNVVMLTNAGTFFVAGNSNFGALSIGETTTQASTWESAPNGIENRNNGYMTMPRTMTDVQGNVEQIMPHGYSTSAYICMDIKTRDGRFIRSGYAGNQMSTHFVQWQNSGTASQAEHIGNPPAIG